MRMMVGEWLSEWLCKEQGVSWESKNQGVPEECGNKDILRNREGKQRNTNHENVMSAEERGKRDFKLVLAEPLEDHPHSHVLTFIQGILHF